MSIEKKREAVEKAIGHVAYIHQFEPSGHGGKPVAAAIKAADAYALEASKESHMAGAVKSVIVISGGTDENARKIEQAAAKAALDIRNRKARNAVGQVTIKILS